MMHHPHVHCIALGNGINANKQKWQACKTGFFLPVKVLSRLFRKLFVNELRQLRTNDRLPFFGELSGLSDSVCFDKWCTKQQNREWVVTLANSLDTAKIYQERLRKTADTSVIATAAKKQ